MNIYVGNLAFSTTDHDLRQLFEPYGVVDEIRVITDRDTGRSKGFGFVEMHDGTAARTAITKFQVQAMEGRTLTVNEAKPREPRREPRQARWQTPRRSTCERQTLARRPPHGMAVVECSPLSPVTGRKSP